MADLSSTIYQPVKDLIPGDTDKIIANLLDTGWVYVDVTPDGKATIGIKQQPRPDAILQFSFFAIYVNCTKGFEPQVGTDAATIYFDDGASTAQGGNFTRKLTGYTDLDFDLHDEDDDGKGHLSEYQARIRLHVKADNSYRTIARIHTYLLPNIVARQLDDHGYTKSKGIYTKTKAKADA